MFITFIFFLLIFIDIPNALMLLLFPILYKIMLIFLSSIHSFISTTSLFPFFKLSIRQCHPCN